MDFREVGCDGEWMILAQDNGGLTQRAPLIIIIKDIAITSELIRLYK